MQVVMRIQEFISKEERQVVHSYTKPILVPTQQPLYIFPLLYLMLILQIPLQHKHILLLFQDNQYIQAV